GYATAPDYAQRLVKIIEDNKLYALSASTGGGVQEAAAAGVQGVAPQSGGVVRVLTIPSSRVIDQAMAEARFELYKNNGVHFVLTRRGETLADIARFFGLSTYTLRRYNNLGRGAQLREGEVIYVEQKASKWRGHHPQHIVSSGETLTEISQTYAVKLRSLKRYNKQSAHGKLRVGDRVDLCKIK
ncbi:MAG: LysM peptidoglycan-binding domain-containing protein, partial [Rikenellaceae bacterium]